MELKTHRNAEFSREVENYWEILNEKADQ